MRGAFIFGGGFIYERQTRLCFCTDVDKTRTTSFVCLRAGLFFESSQAFNLPLTFTCWFSWAFYSKRSRCRSVYMALLRAQAFLKRDGFLSFPAVQLFLHVFIFVFTETNFFLLVVLFLLLLSCDYNHSQKLSDGPRASVLDTHTSYHPPTCRFIRVEIRLCSDPYIPPFFHHQDFEIKSFPSEPHSDRLPRISPAGSAMYAQDPPPSN